MADADLFCPNCGHQIALTEALSARIRAQLLATHQAEHQQALLAVEVRAQRQAQEAADASLTAMRSELHEHAERSRAAEEREAQHRRKNVELEQAQRLAGEKIRLEIEETLRRENQARLQGLVNQATANARSEAALELQLAIQQLADERRKCAEAQKNEIALRQQAAGLEQRSKDMDLELARRLDAGRAEWEASVRQREHETQSLKLKEKELQIDGLRKVIDELKRRSEQGSQERQGEVLELDVQSALTQLYPGDVLSPIANGASGADLVQVVRNRIGQTCGSIIWEIKNTKRWHSAWLAKLREDQRRIGANIAVLVSAAMPDDLESFGQIDGVWVANLACWRALTIALREQLIQVTHARAASQDKGEKMEQLHSYLSGDQFRQKVIGIIEPIARMQILLNQERRAMEKQWKEREKHIQQVMSCTAGMYGEMSGILGGTMQRIPALELDGDYLLTEQAGEGS